MCVDGWHRQRFQLAQKRQGAKRSFATNIPHNPHITRSVTNTGCVFGRDANLPGTHSFLDRDLVLIFSSTADQGNNLVV